MVHHRAADTGYASARLLRQHLLHRKLCDVDGGLPDSFGRAARNRGLCSQ
jgi:hypothetical protein